MSTYHYIDETEPDVSPVEPVDQPWHEHTTAEQIEWLRRKVNHLEALMAGRHYDGYCEYCRADQDGYLAGWTR